MLGRVVNLVSQGAEVKIIKGIGMLIIAKRTRKKRDKKDKSDK